MIQLKSGSKIIIHKENEDLNIKLNNIRWVFPVVNGNKVLTNLTKTLSPNDGGTECIKKKRLELYKVFNDTNTEAMGIYCKVIIDKINKDYSKPNERKEIIKEISLFQTAFIEMESLFINEPRKQEGKVGFHHLLGVLENILIGPNPTIEECIIAMLHDAVEDIPGYTIEHIEKVYGKEIANSVDNISKKPLEGYISSEDKKNNPDIKTRTKSYISKELQKAEEDGNEKKANRLKGIIKAAKIPRDKDYYSNMNQRGNKELNAKFADRLNSFQTMYNSDGTTIDKEHILKKIQETKKYFLSLEIKSKVDRYHYDKLEKKYLEQKEKIDNGEI